MANSLSAHGRRQRVRYSDSKPMRMTLHKELSRRRSISTFKLFGNLGNSSGSTTSPLTSRRKSFTSDELMKTSGFLESRISTTYSSTTSSSADSRVSGSEDDVTEQNDTHRKRRSTAGSALAAVRRKSLTETIASAYRVKVSVKQYIFSC